MSEKKIERLIGIDFGTSTSIVKCKRYQDGKSLGNAHHVESVTFGNGVSDPKAVTLVRINADGSASCGNDAEEEIEGSRVYREFKMDLESDDEEKKNKAMMLTEKYLQYLYQRYAHQESDLGEKGDEISTIISFPAKWQMQTREFMLEVAKSAGFGNVSAMDEPSAALFAVLCRKMDEIKQKNLFEKKKENLLLIIDMGAGTTDLAVCKCFINTDSDNIRSEDIKNEIVVAWPDSSVNITFGGREVDERLRSFLVDYMCDCNIPRDISENFVGQSTAVKSWKENTLSTTLGNNGTVRSCSIVSSCLNYFPGVIKKSFPELNRESFEQLIADKIDDYKQLVNGCLDKLDKDEVIDLVILTGGHSSWYFASEMIQGSIPGIEHPALRKVREEKQRVMRLSNPQETVALGMVYSRLPFNISKSIESEPDIPYDPALPDNVNADKLIPVAQKYLSENLPNNIENKGSAQSIMKYFQIPPNKKAYLWQDTTWLGSGMNGWIITEDGFYYRSLFESPVGIDWREFRNKLKIYCDEKERVVLLRSNVRYVINLPASKKDDMFNFLTGLQTALRNVIDKKDGDEEPDGAETESRQDVYVLMACGKQVQRKFYVPDSSETAFRSRAREFISANRSLVDLDDSVSKMAEELFIERNDTVLYSEPASNENFGWLLTCFGISYICADSKHVIKIPWTTILGMDIQSDKEASSLILKLQSTGNEFILRACRNFQGVFDLLIKIVQLLNREDTEAGNEHKAAGGTINENEWKCILSETFNSFNKAQNLLLLKMSLGVKENENIYFSSDSSFMGNGKRGTIITDRGIYSSCRIGLLSPDVIHFTSWEEFAGGEIICGESNIVCVINAATRRVVFDGSANKIILFNIYKQLNERLKP